MAGNLARGGPCAACLSTALIPVTLVTASHRLARGKGIIVRLGVATLSLSFLLKVAGSNSAEVAIRRALLELCPDDRSGARMGHRNRHGATWQSTRARSVQRSHIEGRCFLAIVPVVGSVSPCAGATLVTTRAARSTSTPAGLAPPRLLSAANPVQRRYRYRARSRRNLRPHPLSPATRRRSLHLRPLSQPRRLQSLHPHPTSRRRRRRLSR